jgi:hypothetical protein
MLNPDVILEGNALISKFMERSHVLNYHESWNLLMPVIEKLTRYEFRAIIYCNPDSGAAIIYDPLNHDLEVQSNGPRENLIESTWKGVINFINRREQKNEIDG